MPVFSRLLLLLLFLAALSTRSVRCQSVRLDVFTEYVEAAWDRVGDWYGQDDFTVTITTPESSCPRVIRCNNTVPCNFSSQTCGKLATCSFNEITVTSSSGAFRTTRFQTAPEPVTDLDVQVVEGILNISWTNPSRNSSTCYINTVVLVFYAVNSTTTTHHPIEEESLEVPLCEANTGEVQVWTTGGNGRSEARSSSYTYSHHDVVDVMTLKSCRAAGCFGIDLAWEYRQVCPYVTAYCVRLDSHQEICMNDTATTSLHAADLREDWPYWVHLSAYENERKVWRKHLFGCSTHSTVVTNLQAEGTSPTSVNATWDPPVCLSAKSLVYEVSKRSYSYEESCVPEDTTNETSYTWTDLESCHRYFVCVAAEGSQPREAEAHTPPRRLTWLELKMAVNDSFRMEWEKADCFYRVQYVVTWGSEVHYTEDTEYTIPGYNSTETLGIVCVAVFLEHFDIFHNVTGPARCSDDPGQRPKDDEHPDDSPSVLVIVLACVGTLMVITVVAGVVAFAWKNRQMQKHKVMISGK